MSEKIAHIESITIGSESIQAAPEARNIECYIDGTLSMEAQINNITQSCYASLHKIGYTKVPGRGYSSYDRECADNLPIKQFQCCACRFIRWNASQVAISPEQCSKNGNKN